MTGRETLITWHVETPDGLLARLAFTEGEAWELVVGKSYIPRWQDKVRALQNDGYKAVKTEWIKKEPVGDE